MVFQLATTRRLSFGNQAMSLEARRDLVHRARKYQDLKAPAAAHSSITLISRRDDMSDSADGDVLLVRGTCFSEARLNGISCNRFYANSRYGSRTSKKVHTGWHYDRRLLHNY